MSRLNDVLNEPGWENNFFNHFFNWGKYFANTDDFTGIDSMLWLAENKLEDLPKQTNEIDLFRKKLQWLETELMKRVDPEVQDIKDFYDRRRNETPYDYRDRLYNYGCFIRKNNIWDAYQADFTNTFGSLKLPNSKSCYSAQGYDEQEF